MRPPPSGLAYRAASTISRPISTRTAESKGAPLLSATLIVRDEADHLPGCLASLAGVVDEIVVVDTGSVDDSVAIAEAHGARVLHRPWQGDFSAPRNAALDAATGRWILYIDADERLRPVDRPDVEELLGDAEEIGFRLRLHPRVGWTPYLEYRLWRNDPRIRFRGAIHEKIVYALTEVAVADGRWIGDCDLTLDHVGYEGDQTRKHLRNLPLLEEQLRAEPDNIFNWTHLSRVLRALDRHEEADTALERAVSLARRTGDDHGGAAWVDLVELRRQRGEDVTDLIAEGRVRWPDNWALVWQEGQAHLAGGRNEEAARCFTRILAVDTSAPAPLAYDGRMFGADPRASLGLALFRLGRYAEAADAYAAAERLEPDAAEYRVKRLLAEARAQGAALDKPS